MAGENTVSTTEGLLKKIHAAGLENLVPQNVSVAKDLGFIAEEYREGDVFAQPVILTREHGYTLSEAGGGGGAFTLNAAVAAQLKEARIQGAEFVLRTVTAYSLLAKAMNGGKRAYKRAIDLVVQNMVETAHWVREFELLYGAGGGASGLSNLGVVESNDDAGDFIVVTKASWAPGIWAGAENMFIDIWDDDYSPQRNAAGTIKVSAVDIENRKLTMVGTEAEMDTIVADDVIHVRGGVANEMNSIDAVLRNTGSLNNIDASVYSLWKASTHSVASAALIFAEVLRGLNKPISRGLQEKVNLYVSIFTWSDLMNDLAALRRYTSDEGELSLGAQSLMYQGANGPIDVKPHTMIKGGEAMALPPRHWERVGPTDLTFKLPGTADNFAKEAHDAAGVELRCWWAQAPFCKKPAQSLKYTNIVNSSS